MEAPPPLCMAVAMALMGHCSNAGASALGLGPSETTREFRWLPGMPELCSRGWQAIPAKAQRADTWALPATRSLANLTELCSAVGKEPRVTCQ